MFELSSELSNNNSSSTVEYSNPFTTPYWMMTPTLGTILFSL